MRKGERPDGRGKKDIPCTGIPSLQYWSALQEYLKGLGEYLAESIDMYDMEPERIGFGEADIVILTMGVEPEKGWRHPGKFYEIHEKLAYHTAFIANACHVKQFIYLSTIDVYGDDQGKITADTKINPKTDYAKSSCMGNGKQPN